MSKGSKEIVKDIINGWKIKQNAAPGYIIKLLQDLYNVLEDVWSVGSLDELKEAISSIGTESGTIFIESGTYDITEVINIATGGSYVIYGHGDNTILKPSAGVNVFNVTNSTSVLFRTFKIDTSNYITNTQAFLVNEASDNLIRFEDITIDGAGTWGIGIELQSNNCSISNCSITDMSKGIYINNSNNHYISFNILTGHSDKGLDVNTGNNIFLFGNICNSNTNYGIYVDSLTYSSLSNNTCNSNGKTGIYIKDSTYNTISNISNNNSENGLYLTGSSHNTISSGTYSNNVSNTADNTAGIMITANSSFNTITANTTDNNTNAGAGKGYGVRIDTSNCYENVVRSNNSNGNDIDYEDEGTLTTLVYYVQTLTELQNAIDSIGFGAGVVHIGLGTIAISSTINVDGGGDYDIRGEGLGTIIDCNGDRTAFDISNARSCRLSNLKIDATDVTTLDKNIVMIESSSVQKCWIEDLEIEGNAKGIGIYISFNQNTVIDNCHIYKTYRGVLFFQSGYSKVLRCKIHNCSDIGIMVAISNVFVNKNTCYSNSIGISASGNYGIITDNNCYSNSSSNIRIYYGRNMIANNVCVGNNISTYGILIDEGGNIFRGNVCVTNTYGIYNSTNNRNIIIGNQCHTNSNTGIYIAGDSNTLVGNYSAYNVTGINIIAGATDNRLSANIVLSNTGTNINDAGTNTRRFGDDTAFAASWLNNLGTPTKNAIYDAVKDEDDMASDSDQHWATQQSIKAYTDNSIKSCLNYDHYILLQDQKAQNTQGGDFNSGSWQTRTLNTEVTDVGGHCTLSSNQITLESGTYIINAIVPAYRVNRHQAILFNVSDTANEVIGSSSYGDNANADAITYSFIVGKFTIASSKTFEIRHRCSQTVAGSGFGVAANFTTEIYTQVELWKVG